MREATYWEIEGEILRLVDARGSGNRAPTVPQAVGIVTRNLREGRGILREIPGDEKSPAGEGREVEPAQVNEVLSNLLTGRREKNPCGEIPLEDEGRHYSKGEAVKGWLESGYYDPSHYDPGTGHYTHYHGGSWGEY